MLPIVAEDLIPLADFAVRRGELFRAHVRYLDRYRRVRVGPLATVVFENRQTLWFRIQEIIRIARLTDVRLIQAELDCLNALLPPPGALAATLHVDIPEADLAAQLPAWAALPGSAVQFHVGDESLAATVLTARPGDRIAAGSHWLQFPISEPMMKLACQRRMPMRVSVNHAGYCHEAELSSTQRQSLKEELDQSGAAHAA